MILLLLLLSACVCWGLRATEQDLYYGDRYSIRMPKNAVSLEYSPEIYGTNPVVLWKLGDPAVGETERGKLIGQQWVIEKVTQKDRGHYTVKDTGSRMRYSNFLQVTEKEETYNMEADEVLSLSFDMNVETCRLIFTSDYDSKIHEVISDGKLHGYFFRGRIELIDHKNSFDVLVNNLKASDAGTFELQDEDFNVAHRVYVHVTDHTPTSSYIGSGVGIFLGVLLCRCCVKCCCSSTPSKTDSPGDNPESPTEPEHRDTTEPPRLRYHQPIPSPRQTNYYKPSNASAGPKPSNASNPPSPFVKIKPKGQPAAARSASPVPDCLSSDPDPRFELQGLSAPSTNPLGSDSTYCDVYTSDKLNFI
ncbi:uncharacterized protein LOC115367066 isoform X2 [Myripristis murdjan]|uniref:uncharacterized protein LOC115367066 isoform X2 n=1 Tax=Myripristis murdjan TaxID=586833 RepID=UPI0011764302|nr:uncharacterized protein LOC115367066 isoform X2 [Myripristis murdjan]